MDAASEFQPLMDEIFREKVLRVRGQSPAEKFRLSFELFEQSIARMRGGIGSQFPHFTEEEVEAGLRRRCDKLREVEERGFFSSSPP